MERDLAAPEKGDRTRLLEKHRLWVRQLLPEACEDAMFSRGVQCLIPPVKRHRLCGAAPQFLESVSLLDLDGIVCGLNYKDVCSCVFFLQIS